MRPLLQCGIGVVRSTRPVGWTCVRTITVLRKRTTPKRKTKTVRKKDPVEDIYRQQQMKELDQKLEQVRQMAKALKLDIAKKEEERVKQEVGDIDEPVDPESEDVDILYNELLSEGEQSAPLLLNSEKNSRIMLFDQPARGIDVPNIILDRIGDSVKNIVAQENQNWNALIQDLSQTEQGLTGVTEKDLNQFLCQIPVGSITKDSIAKINEMIKVANIGYSRTVYDFMMKHHAQLSDSTQVQQLYDKALEEGLTPTKYMFGHLIKAYTKAGDIERVNLTLTKMFERGIEPDLKVYTTVLDLCVRLQDVKQAEDVFQMMKFRSLKTQPDVHAYNTMLRLCFKTRDVLKALDLYQEMLDSRVSPNVFTYNRLALICTKDKQFYRRGWDFIHTIHREGLDPTVDTFESMLALAAKDGDLEFARALYIKIFELRQGGAGPVALNYLLVAYRDFKPEHRPQCTMHAEVTVIRRNILNMVDFIGLHQTLVEDQQIERIRQAYPPLLPLRYIGESRHIIAESNAIWAFCVMNDPSSLNLPTLKTFLRVAIEHGDKEEFLRRYEQFTYPNEEMRKKEVIIEEAEEEEAPTEDKTAGNTSSPPALKVLEKLNYKMERESSLYFSLLTAGRRFKDINLCQRAWEERGKYRKTSKYQLLSPRERKNLDFEFSREMVRSFVEFKMLYEAVAVVKASPMFPWTFFWLQPLYVALLELGDEESARQISQICNKSR